MIGWLVGWLVGVEVVVGRLVVDGEDGEDGKKVPRYGLCAYVVCNM